ncbi:Basic-leucine zipper domain protein [Actinidia chinensis var. chinensis]|uniref:Basic-leucine zipper domain protein n=1 Tax=Actinidia chinensis var. chinensis TaxID=1590841 RepID=A0A2R6RDW6_ACTCC|nr:Basic-leucine zipper domain protein [Actinidia chinensis var. chinensis]
MANTKGSSTIKNTIPNGKHSLLPPKSPFPSISPSYVDYIPSPAIGPKDIGKPREVNSHHQRTSSESFLMDEQPSWLDELLDEPDTPVRKGGHRRSSSDSFAYIDVANASTMDYVGQDDYRLKNMTAVPSWGSQDFDYYNDVRHASSGKPKNRQRNSSLKMAHSSGVLSASDNVIIQSSGSSCVPLEADGFPSTATEKQDPVECCLHDPKAASERMDYSHAKPSASETDTKRAKQQFAQRSRVRKLQYIAELERNVQALQAEGSEVSAELEFVNQQNLILNMENKALKRRLESLAQEQLIKYMEHEVLEREIGRLRALYQQHQQPSSPPSSTHRRSNSRDLDSQFANLSLKQKDASSDTLHI